MTEPKNIYRSTWMHLAGSAICWAMIILYTKMLLAVPDYNAWFNSWNIGFSIFIYLFVFFCGVYTLYLAFTKEPLLSIHLDFIEISWNVLPHKKIKIDLSDILNVDTNWVKGVGDKPSDLIFFLTDEAFERLSKFKLWRRKDKKRKALFWILTNAQVSPAEAVRLIKNQLKLPVHDSVDPYSP